MDISGRYQGASWLHTFEDFWVLNGSALKITPLFLFGGNSRGDEIGQEEAAQRNYEMRRPTPAAPLPTSTTNQWQPPTHRLDRLVVPQTNKGHITTSPE
jgi:hypothetical protein